MLLEVKIVVTLGGVVTRSSDCERDPWGFLTWVDTPWVCSVMTIQVYIYEIFLLYILYSDVKNRKKVLLWTSRKLFSGFPQILLGKNCISSEVSHTYCVEKKSLVLLIRKLIEMWILPEIWPIFFPYIVSQLNNSLYLVVVAHSDLEIT